MEQGSLIYDRTATDPGPFSTAMLNRIEQWTAYLQQQLGAYGYALSLDKRSDAWGMADIPTRSEIDRIRANVDALQNGFYSLPDWREIVYNNTVDWQQANALEWDLQRIYDWLQAMVQGFRLRQANTFFMTAGGVFNNA